MRKEIASSEAYSNILVENKATAQMSYLLQLLLTHQMHCLICGPTGTGAPILAHARTGRKPEWVISLRPRE